MLTCNLVVRVRAGQMNRPDTRIDDPLRRPDRNDLFLLNLLMPGENGLVPKCLQHQPRSSPTERAGQGITEL